MRNSVSLEEPRFGLHLVTRRILIEDRSSGEGFVVDTLRARSVALADARYRSIDAADIASN